MREIEKKRKRRIWAAVLAAAFVLGACGNSAEPSGTTAAGQPGTGTEAAQTPGEESSVPSTDGETVPDSPTVELRRVIEALYDEAQPYSEGFAVVGRLNGETMQYNYIDMEGALLLEEWVDEAFPFSEGLACVGTVYGEEDYGSTLYSYGYIDTEGRTVIEPEYIGYDYWHPLCFRNGYAEVDYLSMEEFVSGGLIYRENCNVIDREGNLLFPFDIEPDDNIEYGVEDGRILSLHWSLADWNCGRYNRWMSACARGEKGNVMMSDGEQTYLIDAQRNILKTISTDWLWRFSDDLYIAYFTDESGKVLFWDLYDLELNPVLEKIEGTSVEIGVDGQLIVSGEREQVSESRWRTPMWIIGMDGTPVTQEDYYNISPYNGRYLAERADEEWVILGADGKETASLGSGYTNIYALSGGLYTEEEGWKEYENRVMIGYGQNQDGKTVQILLDEEGNRLCEATAIQYVSEEVLLVSAEEVNTLTDRKGNVLQELPVSGYIYCSAYADHAELWASEESKDYILREDGGVWSLTEAEPREESASNVLTENEESRIEGPYDFLSPVSLLDASGRVLEKDKAALSLLEGGLYLAAELSDTELGYVGGIRQMYLQNAAGTLSGESYERLGQLSENRIAFMENGKWGYLELDS